MGENYDSDVLDDLESFMARLIPDGSKWMKHTLEGSDDMPAHIRSVLTQTSLTIPIVRCKMALGTWQGVFLLEHRLLGHHRSLTITLQ